jgi:hypothetical protein
MRESADKKVESFKLSITADYEKKVESMNKEIKALKKKVSELEAKQSQVSVPSDDEEEDEGVKIKVEGCGIPEINGTYKQCGMNRGKPKFSQKGRWDGRDAEFKIYCGASYWWILLGEFWHRSCCSEIQFFVAFLSKICSSLHRTKSLLLHGKN